MSDRALVDTSAWISFFRKDESVASRRVKQLLQVGEPLTTGLVTAELIRGAVSNAKLGVLDDLFSSIGHLETKEADFRSAGEMGHRLARKGLTLGIVDLMIAQIAIGHAVPLLTLDRHFELIARHAPLRLLH